MEKDKYFAALPPTQLATEIMQKVTEYFRYMERIGLLHKLRKSYDKYYGDSTRNLLGSSSDVVQGGEQGELSLVRANHYGNLTQHLLVMTTSNRPALECRSVNTDVKSMSQTILGSGILDYYMRDKRVERYTERACLDAILYGEGFVHMRWDIALGDKYGVNPDTNQILYTGDIRFSNPMGPFDVVRDIHACTKEEVNWYVIIERKNKYDLAAQFPEKAEQILQISDKRSEQSKIYDLFYEYYSDSEYIPTYRFYHKVTNSMPEGRDALILDSDLWLTDGPLAYQNLPGGLPVFRMAPDDFLGTPFGYSRAWDLLGLCDVIDALTSTVVTNQLTFGVQNILAPKGHDLTYQQLAGGMNLLEYDPQLGAPEALNLTRTPQEIFNFLQDLKGEIETLSGVNSVVRGNPEASLKSGAALALVASQAVQFNDGLQAEYTALLEDVGLSIIKMLQSFAHVKRAASIAGKSRQYMMRDFSGQDLESINRVIVDVASPIARSIAGRLEIARDMLQIPGVVKSPEQYIQVLNTGRIEPVIEGKERELLNIKSEDEMLMNGQPVQAIITERHSYHIDSHSTILSNPEAKKDPRVVQTTLDHINQHIQLLMTGNPVLLQMRGEQPLGNQGMMSPEQEKSPKSKENLPKSNAAQVEATGEASPMAPQMPRQPSMPKNPLTGQRYNPEKGK